MYSVKVNNIQGEVKARNKQSAEAQMTWVEKNIRCF